MHYEFRLNLTVCVCLYEFVQFLLATVAKSTAKRGIVPRRCDIFCVGISRELDDMLRH